MIKTIKNIIFHNFFVKIIIVILSTIIWFTVKMEEDVTYQLNAQINVKLANNMFLTEIKPQKVKIIAIGRRNAMKYLTEKKTIINLDLSSKIETQKINHHLSKAEINLPPEIFIKKIEPDFVEIKIDKGIKKSLIVKEVVQGNPAPGYMVKKITITPNVVEVYGPESVLKEKKYIKTKPILINGMNKSFTQRVELEQFHRSIKNLPNVNVYVIIEQSLKEKTFKDIPIQIINLPENKKDIKLKPSSVNVTVEGSETAIQTIKQEDIIVYLHATNLPDGKYELPLSAIAPKGIKIKRIEPKIAEISIGLINIGENP